MKKLKFYTKRLSGNEKQKKSTVKIIKRDFMYEINKKRTFKGYELKYSNQYISNEECWLKFVAGSKYRNQNRNINLSRVQRIHWIFIVLDEYKKYDKPNEIYSNFSEYINPNSGIITVTIVDENYVMFFDFYGDVEKPYYLLTSAYYKGKQNNNIDY